MFCRFYSDWDAIGSQKFSVGELTLYRAFVVYFTALREFVWFRTVDVKESHGHPTPLAQG